MAADDLALRVPNDFKDVAEWLEQLAPEAFTRLIVALSQRDGAVLDRSELVRSVEAATSSDRLIAAQLLEMLVSLRGAAERLGVGDIATVVGALQMPSAAADFDLLLLRSRVAELMESRNFDLLFRALDRVTESTLLLGDVRIMSDLRPIFESPTSMAMDGVAIMHRLRLSLSGVEAQDVEVVVDISDLRVIESHVRRAMEKEAYLRERAVALGVPVIMPFPMEEVPS